MPTALEHTAAKLFQDSSFAAGLLQGLQGFHQIEFRVLCVWVIWAEEFSVPQNYITKNGAAGKEIPYVCPTLQVRRPEKASQRDAKMVVLPQRSARGWSFLAEQRDRLRVAPRTRKTCRKIVE